VLQVEIPAFWAMGKSLESHGHSPGIKAVIARVAAPWPQAGYRKDVIDQAVAVRSKNVGAAALRAYHRAKALLFSSAEYLKLPPGASCRNSGSSHPGVSNVSRKEHRMPDYTAAHARAGIDAKLPELETWPNHFPGYEITIRFPEYTSVCPKTGLPDYGTITIQYQPKKLCLELKSLKMYLLAYRDLGIFYENAVNRMLRDFVAAVRPAWFRVTGEFTPRGGLTTTVQADWPSRERNKVSRRA
jgi:7-cyano-7-deazaguanine reductase